MLASHHLRIPPANITQLSRPTHYFVSPQGRNSKTSTSYRGTTWHQTSSSNCTHTPLFSRYLPAGFGLPDPDPHMYTPGHAPKSALHARTGSTSSLSRQLSRTHANSSNPDPNPPITLLTHMYLLPSSQPHVPCLRTTLLGGVCPCVACRLARGIHCQLLGVWARRRHWRSGHWGIRAGARCDGSGPRREGFTRHGDEGGRVWRVWGWVRRHEWEQTEGKGKDDQENATVVEESGGEYDDEDDGDV
ncbi:hypothetical protein L208DRAFT_1398532, partial [Tricholoma matsutake]